MIFKRLSFVFAGIALVAATPQSPAKTIDVVVREGTSMSVAASPDGRTLVIDLQGGLWTLPATGGTAKRITDIYNDAREPVFSPDGKWIAFQGYRDGGWDIWAVGPDGTGLKRLTSGPFDDREPAWSHDGTKVAFSSDRGDGVSTGNYNIWTLDVASGQLTQLTSDRSDDYMPTWGPGDQEVAFIGTRNGEQGVHAVAVVGLAERKVAVGTGRADAPSWAPDGKMVYQVTSRYEIDGKTITGNENVFGFKASFVNATDFYYVSDGKIRKRSTSGGDAKTIEFSATFAVTPAVYTKRRRDWDSRAPRKAMGIVRPVIAPDGGRIAFAALGDIYLADAGGTPASGVVRGHGTPENITRDAAFDTDPAWSPDGTRIAYASDKNGPLNDLWIYDVAAKSSRQLTRLVTSALAPSWSPDGKRIAFLDVDGIWGAATPSVVDVATGVVTKLHAAIFAPGNPTWSPDGKRIAMSVLQPYSGRFREGTNQVLTFSSTAGATQSADVWMTPVKHLSIDSRVGGGPAWSPDGSKMALIYEGALAVVSVAPDGAPLGPPRRLTVEMAHHPSWTADSKQVLYQSMDKLRVYDMDSGASRDVPLNFTFTPAIPAGRVVVHAGQLFDGRTDALKKDQDVVIVGNRIASVGAHSPANHSGRVIDASGQTVMPGLIEHHAHLQKDFATSSGRAYLAWGITTMRSPGGSPYESVEYKEAVEAGVRPGPRIYSTGYLMEWNRVYYNMAVAVSSPAHLDMELQRARVLGHDMLKSYVRMPDLMQKRMIDFAHATGIPVSSHEIFPSSYSAIDMTEHVGATSRRGFSPKQATLGMTYSDVIDLFVNAKMPITPTFALGGAGLRAAIALDSTLRTDPRFGLYPDWLAAQATGGGRGGRGGAPAPPAGAAGNAENQYATMMKMFRAGSTILAGTDTPNAANLHGELRTFVIAGMTPFQALQTATVNPARVLGLDAGSIEAGKLADLSIVEGNPLADVSAAYRVKQVVANGRVYTQADLLKQP